MTEIVLLVAFLIKLPFFYLLVLAGEAVSMRTFGRSNMEETHRELT